MPTRKLATAPSDGSEVARRWPGGIRRAALLIGLIFASVALAVACGGGDDQDTARIPRDDLSAAAALLRSDAAAMRQHGERMVQIGQQEGNDAWVAHGQHLQDDARSSDLLADQIDRTANSLTLFRPSVQLDRLYGDGQTLVKAGQQMASHGQSIRATAARMREEAQRLGRPILLEGVDLLEQDAQAMERSGARLQQAGQGLVAEAERLARSLGIRLPQQR